MGSIYVYLDGTLGSDDAITKKTSEKVQPLIYMILCALHGFGYGLLYAPAQAIMFGLSFNGMISWIITGLPFDMIHGVSNFFCGILIMPIIKTLRMAERSTEMN